MKTVAGAVIDLTRNEKRIGATPGILMILHTWTRQMTYHPHAHLLFTAGGVSDDGLHWFSAPSKFLLPVRALSKIVGARFRDTLEKAKPEVFRSLPRKTWKRAWCCHCTPYGDGKHAVLRYLARYAFRTISFLFRFNHNHHAEISCSSLRLTRPVELRQGHVVFEPRQTPIFPLQIHDSSGIITGTMCRPFLR